MSQVLHPKTGKLISRQRLAQILQSGKSAARLAVSAALKAGELLKPENCSRCLAATQVEAHHENYSRPLDVIWLCSKCHADAHKTKRAAKSATGPKSRMVILLDEKLKTRLANVESVSGVALSKIARITLIALCAHVEKRKSLTFPIVVNP